MSTNKMKYSFFSDLDNTLIYSHRVPLKKEKCLVELIGGKPQSYMTQHTLNFFLKQHIADLIPVTTRTKEQYERIHLFQKELSCKYALVCNGASLLIDGIENKEWMDETEALILNEKRDVIEAANIMRCYAPEKKVHTAQGFFYFIKHEKPESFAAFLESRVACNTVKVMFVHQKVYVLPKSLHKGVAVDRFRKRFPVGTILAAGDSIFDIPMLNSSETALSPPDISDKVFAPKKVVIADPVFSDGICEYIKTLKK